MRKTVKASKTFLTIHNKMWTRAAGIQDESLQEEYTKKVNIP